MLGSHVIRAWSSTQGVVALSSGEAEYYALIKGSSMANGIQAMMDDLAIHLEVILHTDSSAAKGMASRSGLGKTRHIAVAYLWLQEKVARKELSVVKVKGEDNPADLFTKHLPERIMEKHRAALGCEYRDGRHPLMPRVNRGP